MEMRERAAAYLEDFDRVMIMTLAKLYPKLGDLSKYISIEELKSDNIPTANILKERKEHYIYFKDAIITGISFEDFIDEKKLNILIEKAAPVHELKGQIAMKGTAVGLVRVVMKKENIKSVKKGEILITAMTTPDYLPAMHQAAAFVTDEGGITCHAAIVARELKKPCVIGTKFATQIFKTGDKVFVDADKGIVSRLK
jgi:phosphoenolpyruvate synthase/pyruvate phosphate dikinase